MKPVKLFPISICIILLFMSASSVLAEDCLMAREWFNEGLSLSNNSETEAYYYKRAIHFCPEYVAAHNKLGQVYKSQGKYSLSMQAFEQARIQALSNTRFAGRSDSKALFLESTISLGEIYKIQGKYELAAKEFEKALQIAPDSRIAQNHLQYVYKRLHRYDNIVPPNNQLMTSALFTRVTGMTFPKGTIAVDYQFKYWKQRSGAVTEESIDKDSIVFLPGTNHTTPIDYEKEKDAFFNAPSTIYSYNATSILAFRYGLTNNITLGFIPKVFFYRVIDVELDGSFGLVIPDYLELGDTEFLFKYHLWGQRQNHLSFYSILNLPTGREVQIRGKEPLFTRHVRTEEDDGSVRFDTYEFDFIRYVPFGSESFDITPGLAITFGFDSFLLHSNMQYRFTDGKLVGDEFRYNLAGIYHMHSNVDATMELNYRWMGDARRRFHKVIYKYQPDFIGLKTPVGPIAVEGYYTAGGGETLFLSPGLKFTLSKKIKVEFGLQIPIIESTTGWAEEIIYHLALTYIAF